MASETPLSKWVRGLYGEGRKFSSGRALSRGAGRNSNTVSDIENTGKATIEAVMAIARAADFPILTALKMIGVVNDADLDNPVFSEDEVQLLADFRRLSITDQRTVLRVTASLLGDDDDLDEQRILSQMDSTETVSK
tara:strand:- start:2738 stop:3148 length:411 start_codon:yes stop_codon:yes gene_type:complete